MLWARFIGCVIRPAVTAKSARLYSALNESTLSGSLLRRAKKLSIQYSELARQAASDTGFTDETAARQRKLSELEPLFTLYSQYLASTKTMTDLQEILQTTQDPDMKILAEEDLQLTAQALAGITRNLHLEILPRHPHRTLPALIEIRAGIGGDEANIFAGDMLRMYTKYCTANQFRIKPFSITHTEINDGITEAIFSIEGSGPPSPSPSATGNNVSAGAYGRFRGEAGVHRVQRTPATESKGRTHTSTVSINVLPQFPDSHDAGSPEDDVVKMEEVKLEVMRSRGAGGQHVNRTESAVRLTHLPTGMTVSMQDSRSQHANKRAAFTILRTKLLALKREEEAEVQVGLRRSQVSSTDRSEKIRTYNYAQSRVTDHRSGFTSHDLEGIMDGNESLNDLMDSVEHWLANEELMELNDDGE